MIFADLELYASLQTIKLYERGLLKSDEGNQSWILQEDNDEAAFARSRKGKMVSALDHSVQLKIF